MRTLLLALLLPSSLAAGCVISDEPGDTALRGAGWSFGFCGGYCSGDLVIDGDALTLTLHGRNGEPADVVNRGTLTAHGAAELAAIDDALADTPLASVYGCPDCADGGASYVDKRLGGEVVRTSYQFANPPSPLTAADTFLADVMDALETCQATPRLTLGACVAP